MSNDVSFTDINARIVALQNQRAMGFDQAVVLSGIAASLQEQLNNAQQNFARSSELVETLTAENTTLKLQVAELTTSLAGVKQELQALQPAPVSSNGEPSLAELILPASSAQPAAQSMGQSDTQS